MVSIVRTLPAPLDILLLTYNGLENTKECISRLYKHTSNFALTILDNHSTDGTSEYLEDLALSNDNITLRVMYTNLGVVEGRNYLYYHMSKETDPFVDYLMFIDNDQFVEPGWQEVYLKMMNKRKYDIVGSEAWTMKKNRPYKKCISPTESFNYVGCGGMMIKPKVIKDIGLFDENFSPMYFEDPDFCFRAYKAGYKIGWRPFFITHKPHKLLKEEDGVNRTACFHQSAGYFKKKYRYFTPPVFKMSSIIKESRKPPKKNRFELMDL